MRTCYDLQFEDWTFTYCEEEENLNSIYFASTNFLFLISSLFAVSSFLSPFLRISFSPPLMTNYLVKVKPSELFQVAPLFGNVFVGLPFLLLACRSKTMCPPVIYCMRCILFYCKYVRLLNLNGIKGLSCAINVSMTVMVCTRFFHFNESSLFENSKAYIFSLRHEGTNEGVLLCWHPGVHQTLWQTHRNMHYSSKENNALKCLLIEFWLALLKTLGHVFVISFAWLHERTLLGFWQSLIETWVWTRLITGHEVQYLLARGKAKQMRLKIC